MSKKTRAWLVLLIFLNGYVSLSLELVVLRQLAFWVGSSAVITSIIMGTFLGFMSLGYWMGNSKKIKNEQIPAGLGVSFLVIALLTLFSASFPLVTYYFSVMYSHGIISSVIQTFIYSFAFLSIGPFLFGFNTTLLSRCLHDKDKNYTGNIMAVDTIGSVLASMATTLVLMPFFGVNNTIGLIMLMAVGCAVVAYRRWWVWIMGTLLIIAGAYLNSNHMMRDVFGILVNNANSTISVQEVDTMRVLDMNGLPMSMYDTESGRGADYINFVNDNYIYTLPRNRKHKILVLGAGGFTAGLTDKFHEYTFVDIEPTLKEISEKYFLGHKLTDNKHFVVQDASQFLKNTNETYDLILLDVYSNSYQIPEGLITAEFMARIKSRVADNGIVLMNMITSPSFDDAYTRVFDNTFHSVFTQNTSRQVIGEFTPWHPESITNIVYAFYNKKNDGRIYTINKTPVIYDRY
ncbi:MAG: fused MFS/spermidine synthase [Alphaproteobacteria bacterium]|nr:fused MFS/spermidine synthase [Alphaproteobacteria bacterium]